MSANSSGKRPLGQTGFMVTPIGLGVMQFSGGSGMFRMVFPDISQEDMTAIISAALDGGINWFDTAEMYGRGNSEQGLARALHALGKEDDEVIIGTKWLPLFRIAGNIPKTIHDRLEFLEGYSIDLYMVHNTMSFSSVEKEMDAMADLVEQGVIRSVGVSNFNVEQMTRAQNTLQKRGLSLAVNQVQYSLLYRKIESNGVLQAAKDMGVTIVAWSPLARGILSGIYFNDRAAYDSLPLGRKMMMRDKITGSTPVVEALTEIAEIYQASPAQVALNWLINFQGDAVVAIPGASKVYQAEDSAGAMNFRLSGEEMDRLDQLSRDFL